MLTRRDMSSAPINRILKWLAATDLLVMAEYVPFATYNYLVSKIYIFIKQFQYFEDVLNQFIYQYQGTLFFNLDTKYLM